MVGRNSNIRIWSNIVAFVLTVFVNGLAGSTDLLGGQVTGDISDMFPTLVTPAGYVFTIWSVIYILLGAFVIYQALPRARGRLFQEQIGWLFVISSALNISWLLSWQYQIFSVSVVIMFLLLASLILIYVRLEIGWRRVPTAERLAVHLPFSVYLGWITIATIANVSVALVALGWDRFGISEEVWASLIILVALVIAILVAVRRRDIAYELVIIWAFVGIAVNQSSNLLIVILTLASAVVVAAVTILSVLYIKKRPMEGNAGQMAP